MMPHNALYVGKLMHRRYAPVRHELSYNVADTFLDVDRLPELDGPIFGYNRPSLFSIRDRNHGPGDGTPIAAHVRALMGKLKLDLPVHKVFMLCYPAVLGKIFNPLTVYFGYAGDGELQAVIYEVNNTFGQRHSYAVAVNKGAPHVAEKRFYVSPFNPAEGEYRFSLDITGQHLRLNIALFEQGRLKLAARFDGQERPFSKLTLLRYFTLLALQPLKVMAGIHWHAARLWLKGLRLVPRPVHNRFETNMQLPKVHR
jgi:hypothetical protein